MQSLLSILRKEIFPIMLILVLALSRLIPHPWNFTPMLATGIFAGFYFGKFYLSLFIVIFSMFIGDLFLGFHGTMIFTYASLAIAVSLGIFIKIPRLFRLYYLFRLLTTNNFVRRAYKN